MGWPSWAFENHDAPRALRAGGEAEHRDAFAALKMLLLMRLRGNVFLYQGEELGLPQADVPFERLQDPEAIANWPQTLGRDGARTPMPWTDARRRRLRQRRRGFRSVPTHRRSASPAGGRSGLDPQLDPRAGRASRRPAPRCATGAIRLVDEAQRSASSRSSATVDGERLLCVFNLSAAPRRQSAAGGDRPDRNRRRRSGVADSSSSFRIYRAMLSRLLVCCSPVALAPSRPLAQTDVVADLARQGARRSTLSAERRGPRRAIASTGAASR